MHKYLSIFLIINLLASILPSNVVVSVFEFGNLIAHYQEHKNEAKEYSFLQFLEEHYNDEKHIASDPSHHEKLPFHHHHSDNCGHVALQLSVLLPPSEVSFFAFITPEIVSQKLIVQSPQCNASHFSGDIWQPPKV
jgi:hypothetical protein